MMDQALHAPSSRIPIYIDWLNIETTLFASRIWIFFDIFYTFTQTQKKNVLACQNVGVECHSQPIYSQTLTSSAYSTKFHKEFECSSKDEYDTIHFHQILYFYFKKTKYWEFEPVSLVLHN